MKNQDLIMDLVVQTGNLPKFHDEKQLDSLLRNIKLVIRKVFGDNSHYFKDLNEIRFVRPAPVAVSGNYSSRTVNLPAQTNEYWRRGIDKVENLLETMRRDVELSSSPAPPQGDATSVVYARKVFVVHGHDREMELDVARVLSQLEMEAIILHEQADKGLTVIEKLDQYSDVGFAIVLLSPDDEGRKKDTGDLKTRARQNVVLELGFFMGRLGRARVVTLRRPSSDFENPSDTDGVVYTSYDADGAWKVKVAKELRASGYTIDMNQIV